MNDSVSLIVAVVILFLVFRWVLGSNTNGGADGNQRGPNAPRRRTVTPDMVETVKNMFPEVSTAAIQADLALTGSVEITCEKILSQGGLPLPAHILPRPGNQTNGTTPSLSQSEGVLTQRINSNSPTLSQTNMNRSTNNSQGSNRSHTSSEGPNLIEKYQVDVNTTSNLKEPSKVWSTESEKRQDAFLKRKQFMVLEARRKFLEMQKKEQQQGSSQN